MPLTGGRSCAGVVRPRWTNTGNGKTYHTHGKGCAVSTDPMDQETPHGVIADRLRRDLADQMGEWQNYTSRLDYRALAGGMIEAYAEWVTVQVSRREDEGDKQLAEVIRGLMTEIREGATVRLRHNEDGTWEEA